MRNRWGIAAGLVLVLATAGCSDALGDRGDALPPSEDRAADAAYPDYIGDVDYVEIYRNADGFPNIGRTCVLGLGFATPSTGVGDEGGGGATPLLRVPEWDEFCRGKAS